MKNKSIALSIIAIFALTLMSCNKDSFLEDVSSNNESLLMKQEAVTILNQTTNSVTMFAGQTINAGQVSFTDVDTNNDNVKDALVISFNLINGWEFVDVAVWVGKNLADMPANKAGNPVIGQFPYKGSNLLGLTTYSITIPFTAIGYVPGPEPVNYLVAAHASVRKLNGTVYQNETAWGFGPKIVQKGSWATYFGITLSQEIVVGEPPIEKTETAFAYSPTLSTTFEDFLNENARWGWSVGPLSSGNYNFNIYAGAGQNDISKGTLVGVLNVVYNGSSAVVTYNLNFPYTLKEAHLYVGSDLLPKKNGNYTTAPGQYPMVSEGLSGSSYTFNVTGLSGNVYVVAHATVAGF
jgi:hypothetical protein